MPISLGIVMLLLLVFVCTLVDSKTWVHDRHLMPQVVGGSAASDIATMPYQAHLKIVQSGSSKTVLCGAVVVDASWALSVAHCFKLFKGDGIHATLYAGTTRKFDDNGTSAQTREILHIHVHPKYTGIAEEGFDIALLGWTPPLILGGPAASVALLTAPPKAGTRVRVGGFGATRQFAVGEIAVTQEDLPNDIQIAELQVQTPDTTKRWLKPHGAKTAFGNTTFQELVTMLPWDQLIVTGSATVPASPCVGDSGSGLFYDARSEGNEEAPLLAGLVSFGYGCGLLNDPSFFTSIPFHYSWIICMMSSQSRCPADSPSSSAGNAAADGAALLIGSRFPVVMLLLLIVGFMA